LSSRRAAPRRHRGDVPRAGSQPAVRAVDAERRRPQRPRERDPVRPAAGRRAGVRAAAGAAAPRAAGRVAGAGGRPPRGGQRAPRPARPARRIMARWRRAREADGLPARAARRRPHRDGRRPQPGPGRARADLAAGARRRLRDRRACDQAGVEPHVPRAPAAGARLSAPARPGRTGGACPRRAARRAPARPRPAGVRVGSSSPARPDRPDAGRRPRMSDLLDASLPWWAWLSMVLGVVALVSVIGALFLPDWKQPNYTLGLDAAPGSEEFVGAAGALLNIPVYQGGAVTLLQNGDGFYPVMLDAIRGARETITFETYIFEPDAIGRQFMDAFMERARAGIEVRVLVDWFGSLKLKRSHRDELRGAGVKVERFRP